MEGRTLLVPPDQEKAMLLISDFVRADAYGSSGGLINGEIGRVYGFRVMMHNNLSAAEFLTYHAGHVGFGQQLSTEYLTDIEVKSLSTEYALHHVYGVKVLDSGKRGVFSNATGA
jgi:uncharacterized membrane protein YhfC